MRPSVSVRDLLWLLVCGALSSAWCLTAAPQLGATFDEPIYIARGLEGWRNGSHHGLLRLGTMPLPADVQTLPLYLAERWRGQPWDLDADFGRLLPWARAMNLVFWWALLIYGWRIGHALGGPWVGRFATAAIASEPNLLAHAALATTDIASTACTLAFAFHYRQERDAGTWRRVVLTGAVFGIALMAKASALVFGALVMFAIYLAGRRRPNGQSDEQFREPLRAFVADGMRIGLIGLAVMALLCGCDWQPLPSFITWADALPAGSFKSAMAWLADHLCIFSNGFEGLVRQVKHNAKGHGTFLLGEARMGAFWYYFPVLATIKLTLPFLFAPVIVALVRPRSLWNWSLVIAATLFAFSLTYRVQIGIRFLLPCIAFAAVGLSAAAVEAAWSLADRRAIALRGLGIAGLAWLAVTSVLTWPHGLCYVNELWGGRDGGFQLAGDSNYDWGQGLPELARWQADHGAPDLDVWYFGTDPRLRELPMREVAFHALPVQVPQEIRARLRGRRLAVGTTLLYGHGLTEAHRAAAAYLRTLQPAARTTTFLIFDFTDESGPTAETRPAVGPAGT